MRTRQEASQIRPPPGSHYTHKGIALQRVFQGSLNAAWCLVPHNLLLGAAQTLLLV